MAFIKVPLKKSKYSSQMEKMASAKAEDRALLYKCTGVHKKGFPQNLYKCTAFDFQGFQNRNSTAGMAVLRPDGGRGRSGLRNANEGQRSGGGPGRLPVGARWFMRFRCGGETPSRDTVFSAAGALRSPGLGPTMR